jgi:DNA primase
VAISDDIRLRVREANDIAETIARYVPLKKAGRNFKACCPFHNEKTPSFHVNVERQTFKCFGCNEGGSVFDFVMKMERLTFVEALRLLAEKAGITVEDDPAAAEKRRVRDLALRALTWAANVYARDLLLPVGSDCLAYVRGRGISDASIAAFRLGFAAGGWTTLVDHAARVGVPREALEAAGLVVPRQDGSGVYDRFRNRLVIPILDAQARVIGFGARSLDGSEPKYLNSPETAWFKKGHTVYGVERLKDEVRPGTPAIVMEGYTDVILAGQCGVKGAVATLGTALTPDQVRLLSRYTDRVTMLYDGDAAGVKASLRALPLLLGRGLDIRVVTLPGGEDPADFLVRTGPAGAAVMTESGVDLADFALARWCETNDLSTVEGKRRAAHGLAGLVALVEDPVARDAFLSKGATAIAVPETTLRDLALRARVGAAPAAAAPRGEGTSEKTSKSILPADRRRRAPLVTILRGVLHDPASAEFLARNVVAAHFLPSEQPFALALQEVLRLCLETANPVTADVVIAFGDLPGAGEISRLAVEEDADEGRLERLEDAVRWLEDERQRLEQARLREKVRFTGDEDALRELYERHRRRGSGGGESES